MIEELQTRYSIPESTTKKLNEFVVKLIEHPTGQLVPTVDFSRVMDRFDKRKLLSSLPKGVSEAILTGGLLLSMLTECATDAYIKVFCASGDRFNAPWLRHFTERVWGPDEKSHFAPFKWILMQIGFGESDLDGRIKETRAKAYEHTSGNTPIHLSVFGIIQEFLTYHWYSLQRHLLAVGAPEAADAILPVRKRESLHMDWYKKITEIQLAGNPELTHHIAESLANFALPGNKLIPELQEQAIEWIQLMGGKFEKIEQNIVRHISNALNDSPNLLGRVMLDFGASKLTGLELVMLETARGFSHLPRLGEKVETLIGQTVQRREGIFPKTPEEQKFSDKTAPIQRFLVNKMQKVSLIL